MNEIPLAEVNYGKHVTIGKFSSVGRIPMAPQGVTKIDYKKLEIKSVNIGNNVVIGFGVVIYSDVCIGDNCLIGDGVHIREGVKIGNNCIIGIGTKVGARTSIGNYSRVMDLSNVASDASLGDHVFIGPGVMMGNDNSMGREDAGDGFNRRGPILEDYVTVGMNSSVLPNTRIGKDTIIAAGSIVTKDIPSGVMALGSPAKVLRPLRKGERRC